MAKPLDIVLLTDDDALREKNASFDAYWDVVSPALEGLGGSLQWPHPPHLNIVALASTLKGRAFSFALADNAFTTPEGKAAMEALLRRRPRAVGLSTTFIIRQETVLRAAETIRALAPEATLILGGATILQYPELRRCADISVLGEGEGVLPNLMEAIRSNGDLARIPGIEFRRNGSTVQTGPAPLLPPEAIPFPDWGLLGRKPGEVYLLETQRGCVYKCRFCTYPVYSPGRPDGSGLRLWPVGRVIDEIRRNYELYGILNYGITDSTFTFPPKRAEGICRAMIATKLPLRWSCYGRVDNMTPQLASLMYEAGCRSVFFGIESGDDAMLRSMRKDFTREDIFRGVAMARDAGLHTLGSFIIGYPGETPDSVTNTERCIWDAGLDWFRVSVFWVDWNAPVWSLWRSHGLRGRGADWEHATMNYAQARSLAARMVRNIMAANRARAMMHDHLFSYPIQFGLDYDQAVRYVDAKSLLLAYRLSRAESRPVDAFPPAEIRQAKDDLLSLQRRMLQLSLPRFRQALDDSKSVAQRASLT